MNMLTPHFPPLISGLAAGPMNPRIIALAEARKGAEPGLLVWSLTEERLRAALLLGPEEPLQVSMGAFCACGTALQNALGTLAPPETAVQLEWTGGVRLNGGHCGGFSIVAASDEPAAIPDWMVVSLELTLKLPTSGELEPGQTPDWTAFDQEGCGEVDPVDLLGAWARHIVFWIDTLTNRDGPATLYREWKGLVWDLGKHTTVVLPGERLEGTFLGIDEDFGMVLKTTDGTRLIPLTALLQQE